MVALVVLYGHPTTAPHAPQIPCHHERVIKLAADPAPLPLRRVSGLLEDPSTAHVPPLPSATELLSCADEVVLAGLSRQNILLSTPWGVQAEFRSANTMNCASSVTARIVAVISRCASPTLSDGGRQPPTQCDCSSSFSLT